MVNHTFFFTAALWKIWQLVDDAADSSGTDSESTAAVSYTHLTLPTICSV